MSKECGDCLFRGGNWRWQTEECQKSGKKVDFEQTACPYFIEDSHGCCYDCYYGKDKEIFFYCEKQKKKISAPAHWTCSSFIED